MNRKAGKSSLHLPYHERCAMPKLPEWFIPLLPVLSGRQPVADFECWLYTEAAKTLLPENTYAALFWLDYRKTHPRDIHDALAEAVDWAGGWHKLQSVYEYLHTGYLNWADDELLRVLPLPDDYIARLQAFAEWVNGSADMLEALGMPEEAAAVNALSDGYLTELCRYFSAPQKCRLPAVPPPYLALHNAALYEIDGVPREVSFVSAAFPCESDDTPNAPEIYSKALARYLAEGLARRGFSVTGCHAEDWGWRVDVDNADFPLWLGCANLTDGENRFRCFIEPHTDCVRRLWLFKHDTRAVTARLAAALNDILQQDDRIESVEWQ